MLDLALYVRFRSCYGFGCSTARERPSLAQAFSLLLAPDPFKISHIRAWRVVDTLAFDAALLHHATRPYLSEVDA